MIGTGAFWTTLARKIREARKIYVDQLAAGNWSNEVSARDLVARVAAFDLVLGFAADILGENKHPIPPEENEDFF